MEHGSDRFKSGGDNEAPDDEDYEEPSFPYSDSQKVNILINLCDYDYIHDSSPKP